jgi:hypothetical protein
MTHDPMRTRPKSQNNTTAEVITSRRWLRQLTRDVRALTKRLRRP